MSPTDGEDIDVPATPGEASSAPAPDSGPDTFDTSVAHIARVGRKA